MSDQQEQIQPPIASPLAEAQADSLDELFQRLDEHIAARTLRSIPAREALKGVIEGLRRQREAWKLAEAQGKKNMRAKKKSDTTLADIGLA